MGRFLAAQKLVQAAWRKSATDWLTEAARTDEGRYSKTKAGPYEFCLPLKNNDENLFSDLRAAALEYFKSPPGLFGGGKPIPWHDGKDGPSTHLCDSQVCCVNFLFPLRDNREAATRFLKGVFADCVAAVPVQDGERGLIEFEWVGNPALDQIGEGCPRTRGANATSVDAAAAYIDKSGGKHLVLIEWKFTESYRASEKLACGKFDEKGRGKTRCKRYTNLFNDPCGPVDETQVSLIELGYEPFYQFLRQQLLAHELGNGFAKFKLLHIAPKANTDFDFVTSERLRLSHQGKTATEVWTALLRDKSVFVSKHTEELFQELLDAPPKALTNWAGYIRDRYTFVNSSVPS